MRSASHQRGQDFERAGRVAWRVVFEDFTAIGGLIGILTSPNGTRDAGVKRVLLVATHELFRQSFAQVLGASLDLQLEVVEASSFADARALTADLATEGLDAALVDIELPDGDGMALVREMSSGALHIPVLVLSAYLDPWHSDLAWQARQAGAKGLLSKMSSLEEAAAAVKRLTELGS